MIPIDRTRIPEPEHLRSDRIRYAMKELEVFFTGKKRKQARPFDREALVPMLPVMLELGQGKCAYCEQALDLQTVHIDTYRPKDMDRGPDVDGHYWWLAFAWDNLLPACGTCNAAKRNLFPIAGERCSVRATGQELERERPLLLDPTRTDPSRLLEVMSDGFLQPLSDIDGLDQNRVMVTIEMLQLNRRELVSARMDAYHEMEMLVQKALAGQGMKGGDGLMSLIGKALADDTPYALASRCAFAQHADKFAAGFSIKPLGKAGQAMLDRLSTGYQVPKEVEPNIPRSAPNIAPDVQGEPRLMNVRCLEVRNFRILEHAEISVPVNRPEDLRTTAELFNIPKPESISEAATRVRGWKMLLGENGSGKSSMLHALAIALMGREYYHTVADQFTSSLRRGAAAGKIRVDFENAADTIEVEVTPDGLTWTAGEQGTQAFLRAYGATRLLPKRNNTTKRGPMERLDRWVDNLFDPHATLIDAEAWLGDLPEDDLAQACLTLKDLLDISDPDSELVFQRAHANDKGVFGLRTTRSGQRTEHDFTPLQHFSAGYQTIVALACDIMAGSGGAVGEMRYRPGIILIDEIGANLHPRWRTRIMRSFERAFCNMQFICSTHEPLCLHGLGKGEVAVVMREKDHVVVNDDLPSPAGLRTDQLLTSEFFGLHTTLDEATEEAFTVYYGLLAREDELNDEERVRLRDLRSALNKKSALGSSRRDRIVLEAVDKVLAKRGSTEVVAVSEQVQAIIEEVLELNDPNEELSEP